ncbi:MAG: hypothetical protein U9Q03_00940 [Patescibacteria group bacterium]|nr:hypothetical protein [Patescibacteria group bacterium]
MRQTALLLGIILTSSLLISGSCPNRSSTDDFVTRIQEARNRIQTPSGEITLLPGERVLDVDINCLTTEPQCLVILTRPMHRRERPRSLKLHLPYAERPLPSSITIQETARERR